MLERVLFLVGAVLEDLSCGNAELFQMHFFMCLVQHYGTINVIMW